MSCLPPNVPRPIVHLVLAMAALLVVGSSTGCRPGVSGEGWLAELPKNAPDVVAGARVWYAEPVDGVEAVRWGLFTVTAVADGLVLADTLGVERTDVAPALVLPVEEAPTSGRVVALHPAAGIVLGEIVAAPDTGASPTVAFDWNGTRVETSVAAVRSLSGEPSVLEPVAFRIDDGWSRGWIVTLDGERAWIADATGRVAVRPIGEIHPLVGLGRERSPDDAVLAFTWADGFVAGTVEAAEEDGYRVRNSAGETRRMAATELVDPAAWFD